MPRGAWLMVCAACLPGSDLSAQERGIELQAGAGYVFDSGEGPSVPATTLGAIGWITRGWGLGARLSEGLRDERGDLPRETHDGFVLGPGDLRIWSLTSQWRGSVGGTEINVGVGVGGHGFRHIHVRQDSRQRFASRSGSGFVAFELMAGRRLSGAVHLKAGLTYGLAGDLHPFQPLAILAFTP